MFEAAGVSGTEAMRFAVNGEGDVSGLLLTAALPLAGYVLAHGAGAGMTHPFMAAVAERLAARAVAPLRYQFPSMERGSKRADSPTAAHATVRAAVDSARDRMPGVRLFAGGKSFGGRMASQAQAESLLPGVAGLVFFAFPLHLFGKPSVERPHIWRQSSCPCCSQGTRDTLATMDLLGPAVESLRADLFSVEDADNSFNVPARTGKTDGYVLAEMLDASVRWMPDV